MTYYSKVADHVFLQIKHGHKIIEPRLNDAAHRQVRLGDLLVVINRTTKQELVAKVVGILHYPTFAALFAAFPPQHFGAGTIERAKQEVGQWYPPQAEATHGVVGMKLHVLRNS